MEHAQSELLNSTKLKQSVLQNCSLYFISSFCTFLHHYPFSLHFKVISAEGKTARSTDDKLILETVQHRNSDYDTTLAVMASISVVVFY